MNASIRNRASACLVGTEKVVFRVAMPERVVWLRWILENERRWLNTLGETEVPSLVRH